MPFDYLISAFVTLLVVVDPIGLAPVFAGLTAGLPRRAQRQVAQRACLIAGAVLFGTALVGDALLRGLGITPSAFEIAGGLLLFLVATEMVLGTRLQEQSKTAEQAIEDHVRNIAAFPIAIPLMAGPGAIAATILLSAAAYTTVMWVLLILERWFRRYEPDFTLLPS
jgi:multiple antibiotic resistance protein